MVENPLTFESSKTRRICDAFDDAWAFLQGLGSDLTDASKSLATREPKPSWQRRTNVWRKATSPAPRAGRLKSRYPNKPRASTMTPALKLHGSKADCPAVMF